MKETIASLVIPELIGRQKVLDKVFGAIRDPQPVLHVLYLSGDGGLGKTRLLQHVLDTIRGDSNVYVPETLLDLYHVELHTLEGFMKEVVRVFPEESKFVFDEFEKEYRTLNQLRVHQEGKLAEQQNKVEEAFEKGMRSLCEKRRVVLMLDTVERAVYYTEERGIPHLADTIRWLNEKVGKWRNLTLIFAGRKRAETVWNLFRETHSLPSEHAIPIGTLSIQESREYLKALERYLRERGETFVAERLAALPEDVIERVCKLSEGRPILLSLFADYFSVARRGQLPPSLNSDVNAERRNLEEELVSRFLESGELGETITALGRAPRGVDARLLAKLLEIPENEAKERLQSIKKFTFVKARSDETYFLHDEMYALMRRQVYDHPKDSIQALRAFTAIKEDVEKRLERVSQQLEELYAPVLKGTSETLRFTDLAESYSARRKWLGFKLFYFLCYDFERGLRHFFRFAQEALRGRDVWMGLQLEAELWDFLSTYYPHPEEERLEGVFPKKLLQSLLEINRLYYAYIEGDNSRFEELSRQMEETAREQDWANCMPIALLALYTTLGDIYSNRGTLEDSKKAESYLQKACAVFPEEVEKYWTEGVEEAAKRYEDRFSPLEVWYMKAYLARAVFARAYTIRMRGKLQESVPEYQKAIALLRQINLQVNLATAMNDLGFTHATLGNWDTAYRLILDAMDLHQKLSIYASLCYDLNALSRAKIMEGHSLTEAIQLATRALALSRALGFTRVMGMSYRNLAEANRRSARNELLTSEEKRNLLRQAREYAYESRFAFEKVGETARLIEAWMEIGCATRDWVKLEIISPDPTVSVERLFQESRHAFQQAIELAQKEQLHHKELDARANLAWLEYYRLRNTDPISEDLKKAIEEAENRLSQPGESNPEIRVWAGKIYVLKGVICFHELQLVEPFSRKAFSSGQEDAQLKELLEKMGENFARGLQESAVFSENSQGIRNAKQDIYKCLKLLNTSELKPLCRKVKEVQQESVLEKFLREVMLWVE